MVAALSHFSTYSMCMYSLHTPTLCRRGMADIDTDNLLHDIILWTVTLPPINTQASLVFSCVCPSIPIWLTAEQVTIR